MHVNFLHRSLRVSAALALATLLSVFGAASTAIAQSQSGGAGPLRDLQPASSSPVDTAAADLTVVETSGSTTLSLAVRGLDAPVGTTYGASVHYGTCLAGDPAAAGPRFNDTGEPALRSDSPHEVTLDFTVTAVGSGSAATTVAFVIPAGKVNSMVITDADGVRLACLPVTIVAAASADEVQGISETAAGPVELAFTGAETEALTLLGLSLVGAGATVLIWRRRLGAT